MKKLLTFVLILFVFCGTLSVSADDVDFSVVKLIAGAMQADFGDFLDKIGSDVDNVLIQHAVTGYNIGQAEFGDEAFSDFYIGLPAVGLTVAPPLQVLETDLYETLFKNSVPESVNNILEKAFPVPSVRLNFGMKLPANLEVLVNGMWFPELLTGVISENMNDYPDFNGSFFNLGALLRYVLIKDSEFTPGLSIGAGASFGYLGFVMDIEKSLNQTIYNTPEGAAPYPFKGANFELDTSVIAFGINVTISKELSFFCPYFNIGAWYGITNVESHVLMMKDSEPYAPEDPTLEIASQTGHSDLEIVLSSGFDLLFGPFVINIAGDYNLGSGFWGVNIGSRIQP